MVVSISSAWRRQGPPEKCERRFASGEKTASVVVVVMLAVWVNQRPTMRGAEGGGGMGGDPGT